MSDLLLTAEQTAVIQNRGGTLLVSAAAGSGKTKVLVERVMDRIQHDHRDITEFLIITFTNAAAAELRMKISNAITDAITKDPSNHHLLKQRGLVHLAQISTIHSFCATVIRQYGYQLEISPDYTMLDEDEGNELRLELLSLLLEEEYTALAPDFCALTDTIGAGRSDSALEEAILYLFSKSMAQPYPERWLDQQNFIVPENATIGETWWGRIILLQAKKKIQWLIDRHRWALSVMEHDPLLQKKYYPAYLDQCYALERLLCALDGPWDAIIRHLDITYMDARVSHYPDESLKNAIKEIRNDMKSLVADLLPVFARTEAELIEEQNSQAQALSALKRVTKELCRRFSEEKRRRGVLDFNDQEHLAIELLVAGDGKPTANAMDLRERFYEIMVDEYQDSNSVQELIFKAISKPGDANRFLVGDIKQSIYGFREAEPEMFSEKYVTYQAAELVTDNRPRRLILSKNFRSRPEILEAANHVFRSVMSEEVGELCYGDEEALYPGRTGCPEDQQAHVVMTLLTCDNTAESRGESETAVSRSRLEAEWTAEKIVSLLQSNCPVSDGTTTRSAKPGDIAILLRSNLSTADYKAALVRRGVPVASENGVSLFEAAEIRTVLNYLRILDNPHQNIPLAAVLTSPVYHFSNDLLTRLRTETKAVQLYDALAQIRDPRCMEVRQELDELRKLANSVSADELLWEIYNRAGIVTIYTAMENGSNRNDNLMALYEYVRTVAAGRHLYLYELLRTLERAKKNGRLVSPSSSAGVTITTIHKSKGLEYPIVFLCDLSRKFNFSELNNQLLIDGKYGIASKITDTDQRVRYPGIAWNAMSMVRTGKLKSEELRILYVAMTRAKDYLFMNYSTCRSIGYLSRSLPAIGMPTEVWAVNSAGCLGDWVLLAAMNRVEAGNLFQIFGHPMKELTVSEFPWKIEACEISNIDQIGLTGYTLKEVERDEPDTVPDPQTLVKVLNWEYGHKEAARTPSKVTASDLKGRYKDLEAAEYTSVSHHQKLSRPEFILEQKELTATEKGSAAHLFLQYGDYREMTEPKSVCNELQRMVDENFMTQKQADAVNPEQIVRLFSSPLGKLLLEGKSVIREFKFSVLEPAEKFYRDIPSHEEQILVQGVIDAAVISEQGITIIDFKTDQVTDVSAYKRAEEYRPQLELYKGAMQRIFGIPVKQCVLWFLKPGISISL